jgi:LPXTG-site transpeptidase (sortase) family protein
VATQGKTETLAPSNPVRVTIPDLGLNLSVIPGAFEHSQWLLSETQAQFAVVTAQPNLEAGNTLLYGHNTHGVFGELVHLQPGAEVFITTANQQVFIYRYHHSQDVVPSDVSILEYQGPPRLTLLTCSGLGNQTRRLYTFELVPQEEDQ